jgi:hypothetical protein
MRHMVKGFLNGAEIGDTSPTQGCRHSGNQTDRL